MGRKRRLEEGGGGGGGEVDLFRLPRELLTSVLLYLDLGQQLQLELVCCRWRDLLRSNSWFWQILSLEQLPCTERLLRKLCFLAGPSLRSLTLPIKSRLTTTAVGCALVEADCRWMRKVDIKRIPLLPSLVDQLGFCGNRLKSFTCALENPLHLTSLLQLLPRLAQLSELGIYIFSTPTSALTLEGTFEGLQFKGIDYLRLSIFLEQAWLIEHSVVDSFLRLFPRISRLTLEHALPRVQPSQQLLAIGHQLKEFRCASLQSFPVVAAGETARLRVLCTPRSIYLDHDWVLLHGQLLTQLEEVDFSECAYFDDDCLQHLAMVASARLKRVTLRKCPLLTDQGLGVMAKQLSTLEHLDVSYNHALTGITMTALGGMDAGLTSLNITGCLRITGYSVLMFMRSQAATRLTVLYLSHSKSAHESTIKWLESLNGPRICSAFSM